MNNNDVLLVIDVQEAFNQQIAMGRGRNNPNAVANIEKVLAFFRKNNLKIIHIHHASTEQNSLFRPELSGFPPMKETQPINNEMVIVKNVNSAFIGTNLHEYLTQNHYKNLYILGATTNHCVETTTRMAGNLGYNAILIEDACWAMDMQGYDGQLIKAQAIHEMSLNNLNGEFAKIIKTGDLTNIA